MDKYFSREMFYFTEKVGMLFPEDTQSIIKHRYLFAESFSKNRKVLEIGVGQGYGLQSIGKVAEKYTGLEYSQENIEILHNSESKFSIYHGDAHQMPFQQDEFEVIIALAMVYYLNYEEFLIEAKRVLKSNGLLLFCTSNKNVSGFVPSPHTTSYFSVPELKDILYKNGFDSEFYGSFPSFNKLEYPKKYYGIFKDFVKKIINLLPYGEIVWQKLRNANTGVKTKLPFLLDDIKQTEDWTENFNKLPDNEINTKYRVVYCVAKLTNNSKKQ